MGSLKLVLAAVVFFMVNSSDIYAKSLPYNVNDTDELNVSIQQLQHTSVYAWQTMNSLKKKKGYHRSRTMCMMPTFVLYKRKKYTFFNGTTMREHLKKINDTLFPLREASSDVDFSKNATNYALKVALRELAADIHSVVRILWRMGHTGSADITYNTGHFTNKVHEYMQCAHIKITNSATQFLRYATFVETVQIAATDLNVDLAFIQKQIGLKS